MTTTEKIIESIDDRVRDLTEQIETLVAARGALISGGSPKVKRPPRNVARSPRSSDEREAGSAVKPARGRVSKPRTGESRSARQKPAVAATRTRRRNGKSREIVTGERLELLLSENGGMTTSVLVERSGVSRDQILALLRELEAAGRIRRTGQRRSTRWHAITDEERIEKRAAELAALSKKAG
jgi:hypothetical protein